MNKLTSGHERVHHLRTMPPKNNLARKLQKAQDVRTFAVIVPSETVELYDEVAHRTGRELSMVMSERLERCAEHTADKPLYVNDVQRQALEVLLGYNFSNAEELVTRVRSLFQVIRIDTDKDFATLVLDGTQMYRLNDRAKAAGVSVSEYARTIASRAINQEIGLY